MLLGRPQGLTASPRFRDPASGAELRTLRGHHRILNWAAFSPDGHQLVTAGNDATVRVWEVETGKAGWSCEVTSVGW